MNEPIVLSTFGPFSFDRVLKTMTMQPGVYTLTEPLVFGADVLSIKGLTYQGPEPVNATDPNKFQRESTPEEIRERHV